MSARSRTGLPDDANRFRFIWERNVKPDRGDLWEVGGDPLAVFLAGAFTWLLASALVPSVGPPARLESAVLFELNRVRAEPHTYMPILSSYRAGFKGDVVYEPASDEGVETEEGPRAVDEAVRDLEQRDAAPTLAWDDRLAASAADLADDQRRTGATGHEMSNGVSFGVRLSRYMPLAGRAGEIIAYGETTQEAIIRAFIVDDGVPDRAHRLNLFAKGFRRAGIACRPHPTFGVSCVVDMSS